jgi:AcrR family transcriptional regulator
VVVPRDARATKTNLLRAATDEFAQHGIAGARVDRIAATAGYNKNLIYVHFGSKEQLFDAVFEAATAEILDAAPFDAYDLPGYAGALFDFHRGHPHLMRLARWHALERPGEVLPVVAASTADKLRALAAAQKEGAVDAALSPERLLTLLVTLSGAWSEGSPETAGAPLTDGDAVAARDALTASVARLAEPRPAAHRA